MRPSKERPDGDFGDGLGADGDAAWLCGSGDCEGKGDGLGDGKEERFGATEAVGDDAIFGDEQAAKSRMTIAEFTARLLITQRYTPPHSPGPDRRLQ